MPGEVLRFHRRIGGAAVPKPEDAGPRVVGGRYEIRGLLGSGGMGSVFRAFDRELEETVALKMIRSDLLQQPELRERFRKEVKLARRITHRNVARVFDIGEASGQRFLTMELVEGRSLAAVFDAAASPGARMPIGEVVRVGRELALGLAAAHAVGVIHRDLKPDNALIAEDGRVVITDFGIARSLELPSTSLTLSGRLLGTPDYLSPELIAGVGPADARSDIFALGVILFEALTGRMPWDGDGIAAPAARLTTPPPDPRSLRSETPAPLAALVLRCLARAPDDRPGSAARLAQELDELPVDPSLRATLPDVAATWSPDRMPPALVPHVSGARSVAVLPFDELGHEQGSYFSDGVTEVLIESLGSAPALVVRPRGMIMPLRGSGLDTASLGRTLAVDALVFGAIARSGDTVDVSVRVLDARFGFQLGSFRRTCSADQVFALVDELAGAIATTLSSAHPPPRGPTEPSAEGFADLMFRARHAYHSFWQEETAQAIALFERALALCPRAPRALAGHALACLREGFFTGAGMDRVRAAIERTSAVEPDLPELHLARASVLVQDSDPVAAVAELRRALEQAPGLAEASWLVGRLLLEADAVELAAKRLAWALVIEPALSVARRDCTRASALLGRWDEAERISSAEPGGHVVGPWLDRSRYAMWKRDGELARSYLTTFPDISDGDPSAHKQLAIARALLVTVAEGTSPFGDPALQDFGARAASTRRRGAFAAQIEAEVHAFLGRREDALRAIDTAVQAGLTDLAWLERCPLFEGMREEPSFTRARVAIGRIAAPVRDAILGS